MTPQRRVARALSAFAFVAVAGGVAACGPLRRGHEGPPTYIYFTNDSQDQADVYAVFSGSQRVRIGTVFSNRTETLVLPPDVAARGTNVSVVARLLARRGAVSTGPLAIQPGDRLSVRLSPNTSTLIVLPGAP